MKYNELRKELEALLEEKNTARLVKAGDITIAADVVDDGAYTIAGAFILGSYCFPAFELVERPSGLGFDCTVLTDYPCDEELEDIVKATVHTYNLKRYDKGGEK